MTEGEKALAACVELVAANAEVRRLSTEIGEALNACLTYNEPVNDGKFYAPPSETHLARAYAHCVDEEAAYHGGDGRVYNEPDEQAAILAECPYCSAAHKAIQLRKLAKKRLGTARRIVTMIGKRATKGAGNA